MKKPDIYLIKIYLLAVVAVLLLIAFVASMVRCTVPQKTVKPNYYQVAKEAERLTNSKPLP